MTSRPFPLILGAAITIAALTQSISAMAQRSERAWLQAYAVASGAITSYVVARDAFISYTVEPTEELSKRLAEANRDWDKLLLRLYGLNAPSSAS